MVVKKGGKKQKKKKAVSNEVERPLVFKENGQEYGKILRLLGSCRVEVKCVDNKTRIGHICGRMRKKVWIVVNDVVLLSLRDFQDDKADIILKYSSKEVNLLKGYGEIPETMITTDTLVSEEPDIGFDFGEDEDDIKKEPVNFDLL